jgi:hypothetical protein
VCIQVPCVYLLSAASTVIANNSYNRYTAIISTVLLIDRGRHRKRYSVIAITIRYIFALSHNDSTLWRKVIASFSYRFGLIEIVIASYSYRSSLIGIVIASYSYRSKVTNRYRFL